MKNEVFIRFFLFVSLLLGQHSFAFSQSDVLTRNLWYNEEKTSKLQLYLGDDGKYYGKIVWLAVANENGKPRTDINNPDKARRNNALLGLVILKGLKKSSDNAYEDGTIYDPKNGKTYSCKMTLEGDKLNLRGFVGFSLFGRTTTWTKTN